MRGTESEEDFGAVMAKIRDLRRWTRDQSYSHRSVRHGLLLALEMDTRAALRHGVNMKDLWRFDLEVKEDAKKWIDEMEAQR